jgi:hypothetical protein
VGDVSGLPGDAELAQREASRPAGCLVSGRGGAGFDPA